MPIADWTVPFELTSAVYSSTRLPINTKVNFPLTGQSGYYLLREQGCALRNNVRSTKDEVPQQDGAILHRRFTSGMEMDLVLQFWETTDKPACDALLNEMLDTLMGYLYGLLNAGDNEGRIQWQVTGFNERMLDDIRLLTYPAESHGDSGVMELATTVDCALPYAEDLAEVTPHPVLIPFPGVNVTNGGNRPTFPVFQIYGAYSKFTLRNVTTSEEFNWDSTQPGGGGVSVGVGNYLEIDMFRNTVYLNGNQNNKKGGVVVASSEFFPLVPGVNQLTLALTGAGGTPSVVIVNSAWA